MQLSDRIIEATSEIFTTMVMMEVEVEESSQLEGNILKDSITGLIGLAGNYKGVVAIHLPQAIACEITSQFLGVEVDGINDDVEDAVGEIANMLGGNIKSFLSESGKDIDLSLPSTISGSEYEFQVNNDVEKIVTPFSTSNGIFFVELQLEKN